MNSAVPQARISYRGELAPLLAKVCRDYRLGELRGWAVVPFGYQDFNLSMTTTGGRYFVKIFAAGRSHKDAQRYLDVLCAALAAGIRHPKLYQSDVGFLHELELGGAILRLAVFEHLCGKNLFESQEELADADLLFLAHQAARIGRIKLQPEPIYDHWSCSNFASEYADRAEFLDKEDLALIEPLYRELLQIDLTALPHCLVHGDLVRTNIMRADDGRLYILDFAVASSYPRVQELAVLFCDLFFSEQQTTRFADLRERAINIYLQETPLTNRELVILPLYTKVAHAMQVLCATYEAKVNGNTSPENASYLRSGRSGLRLEPL